MYTVFFLIVCRQKTNFEHLFFVYWQHQVSSDKHFPYINFIDNFLIINGHPLLVVTHLHLWLHPWNLSIFGVSYILIWFTVVNWNACFLWKIKPYFYYISKVEELWNDFSINLIRINTFIQSFTISLAVFQS